MIVLRKKLVALCILAFWLAGTQHCGLEAAELLGAPVEQGDGCCDDQSGCVDDGCGLVEDGAYRACNATLLAPAPQLFVCLIRTIIADTVTAAIEASSPGVHFDRPLNWVPTWQFVQRAALSPRAPTVTLA